MKKVEIRVVWGLMVNQGHQQCHHHYTERIWLPIQL